jgi:hypothetical protein
LSAARALLAHAPFLALVEAKLFLVDLITSSQRHTLLTRTLLIAAHRGLTGNELGCTRASR